jgi:hypothetical protein
VFVNNFGDNGDVIGRVAGTSTGELVFHSVFMFRGHVSAEKWIGSFGSRFGSPDFECVVEKACFVHVVVA